MFISTIIIVSICVFHSHFPVALLLSHLCTGCVLSPWLQPFHGHGRRMLAGERQMPFQHRFPSVRFRHQHVELALRRNWRKRNRRRQRNGRNAHICVIWTFLWRSKQECLDGGGTGRQLADGQIHARRICANVLLKALFRYNSGRGDRVQQHLQYKCIFVFFFNQNLVFFGKFSKFRLSNC